jgi:hypothetical protein
VSPRELDGDKGMHGPDSSVSRPPSRIVVATPEHRNTPVHVLFIPRRLYSHPVRMGDFFAVLGIIAFALVMLGLIWGLEHV